MRANVSSMSGVDLALDDAVDVVFDRVLGGDDLAADVVQFAQGRIERGRLAGAGRAGDDDDAVGLVDQLAERCPGRPRAGRSCPGRAARCVRSSTRMTTLSPNIVGSTLTRRSIGWLLHVQLDAAVLRHAALGDVEVRHDLDAAS